MKSLEIYSHCWRFSRVLAYQLSSLVLYPPTKFKVNVLVFCDPEDRPTWDMMDFFDSQGLDIRRCKMKLEELMVRAIGRNAMAKITEADLVWFADADYVFGEGCLDALADLDLEDDRIYYPVHSYVNGDKETGDQHTLRVKEPGVYGINPADFIRKRSSRAIGGLQIVTGKLARERGYCDGCRIQRARSPKWRTTFGDRIYRDQIGQSQRIQLPNLYRIRQLTQGVVDTLGVADAS